MQTFPPIIITRHPDGAPSWVTWRDPLAIHAARSRDDVHQVLAAVHAAGMAGRHAVGFIAYEAGPAFDPALVVHPGATRLPLAWFAIFDRYHAYADGGNGGTPPPGAVAPPSVRWRPTGRTSTYRRTIQTIKQHIAAGDTYQVNYTFPLAAGGPVDLLDLFFRIYDVQPSPYAIYLRTPAFEIASVSPELFFRQDGDGVTAQPMKGTCPRAPHPGLDQRTGEALRHSEKNRAENLMIVDMVRNDLGRVARPNSITVEKLFEVTAWPTLWQMTSTIRAETGADLPEIMAALFPSASITGAPKLKTSEIIASLETGPRGVYTGAIGWCGPGRRSQWAVAIRTVVKTENDPATYHVGSGIVWDSSPDEEYRECLLKSRILAGRNTGSYRLLETMLWRPGAGYHLLDAHLQRMAVSAGHLGFPFPRAAILEKLKSRAAGFGPENQRIRLLLRRDGRIALEAAIATAEADFVNPESAPIMSAAIDPVRLDPGNPFLYHKTTRRRIYARAMSRAPGMDDTLLVNNRGELMEFTTGNLVVQRGREWLTPPLSSGLLPGVFRQTLLERGTLREQALALDDLSKADGLYFINSVRGWRRVCIKAGLHTSQTDTFM